MIEFCKMKNVIWVRFLGVAAIRNLGRTPRRTVISLLAIAAALAALLIFESFVAGVKKTFRHNLITTYYAHYQIMKEGYLENKGHDPFGYQISNPELIRQAIVREIGQPALFSARQTFSGMLAKDNRSIGARGIGVDAVQERGFLTANRVSEGTHLAERTADGVFLGVGLARQLGIKVGDTVTVLTNTVGGSLNALDLSVVGTFRSGINELDDVVFYLDKSVCDKLLRSQGASQILIGFAGENELAYRPKLASLLRRFSPELRAHHWRELAGEVFDNSMGWIESQFRIFRWIIIVIATLSISNVFTISMLERVGEFGTLRAIGAHRKEVAALIFVESLVQTTVGALFGVAIGLVLIRFGLVGGVTMPPPPNMSTSFHVVFDFPWSRVLPTVALCIAVAGGAGILPALKISRMNIISALGRNI